MQAELAQEIIHCLPRGRRLFHYYKDYYAVYLLQRELERRGIERVTDLKKSRYANFLFKPLIKTLLAEHGDGCVCADDFDLLWNLGYETYVLTLGTWGQTRDYRYYQTSRPGTNLVLQLNFCRRHDQLFRYCIADDLDLFCIYDHPISRQRSTLAWARIDLDLDADEALIEEIQNDWLREADDLLWEVKYAVSRHQEMFDYYGLKIYVDRAFNYFRSEIERHRSIWSEAMLSATIKFLLEEIGIKTIYYHSFTTGAAIKHIDYCKPPRSLYTRLPSQFCFELVEQAPAFLARDRQARRRLRKIRNPQWFRMDA